MTNQFSSNRIGSPPPAELEHQRDSLLQQATEAVSRISMYVILGHAAVANPASMQASATKNPCHRL